MIAFVPNEWIVSMDVWVGYSNNAAVLVVQGLSFHTNVNSYGPYGLNSGTKYSESGLALAGFYGSAGVAVDSIGFLWEACD